MVNIINLKNITLSREEIGKSLLDITKQFFNNSDKAHLGYYAHRFSQNINIYQRGETQSLTLFVAQADIVDYRIFTHKQHSSEIIKSLAEKYESSTGCEWTIFETYSR